jgi:hypothetical protein
MGLSDLQEELTLLQKVDALQEALVASATSDEGDTSVYAPLRQELMAIPTVKELLPDYVTRYRHLGQFWTFIKAEFATYADRRRFIWDSFAPLVAHLEEVRDYPSDAAITLGLSRLDANHVRILWQKALGRREADPDGAITASRTLVESVCKLILDERRVTYDDDAKLPALYARVASTLNLAPSQHSEKVFRQILGGCQSVVEGLGAARNRLGDSHGQGKRAVRPAPRHAELAVNLAGAMSLFLVSTWEARRGDAA